MRIDSSYGLAKISHAYQAHNNNQENPPQEHQSPNYQKRERNTSYDSKRPTIDFSA